MPGSYSGAAFVLSWTSPESRLLGPYEDEGSDLLFIDLHKSGDQYEAYVTRIAKGFDNPVDAVLVGETLYVIEHGGERWIWSVALPHDEVVATEDLSASRAGLALYPNPVQSTATIRVGSDVSQSIRVTLFDVLGRQLEVLYEGMLSSGQITELTMDSSGLAPGVYFVKIRGEGFMHSRPVVVN